MRLGKESRNRIDLFPKNATIIKTFLNTPGSFRDRELVVIYSKEPAKTLRASIVIIEFRVSTL